MLTNTDTPEVVVVTASDYTHKSFITPAADAREGLDSPKIQAIMKQAFYVLDQHDLGHVALASPPSQGLYLVISLPEGCVCNEAQAKAHVSRIISRAYWRSGASYEKFSHREVEAISGKTAHLTNHHVKLFHWDQQPCSNDKLRQRAGQLVQDKAAAITIKAELPMFRCLENEQVDGLVHDGRLLTLLDHHLEPRPVVEALEDCEHHFDRDDYLEAYCDSCKEQARFACSNCHRNSCPACRAEYNARTCNEADMRALMHVVGTASNQQAILNTLEADMPNFVKELPPTPDPGSPAAVRLAEEFWAGQEALEQVPIRNYAEMMIIKP